MPLASLISRLLPRFARSTSEPAAASHSDLRRQAASAARERYLRRMERQFALFSSRMPWLRGVFGFLRGRSAAIFRLPLGLALVAGGLLAILPVFGLWMIPAGLLLLSVDLAPLRPPVSAAIIRLRRRWTLWRRRTGP
ncbi:hypothetical protein [Szabonella alba]|uniref:Transmembrane protein (PGPGW) n=1 Tax=Szabonella alba TaxID=2804194 RepID=A0A8K0VBH9_9RHOB|nr:hypothetical protein [Szabonella alba]MBL4916835.1 hypothetical protein [Szabonella alba]